MGVYYSVCPSPWGVGNISLHWVWDKKNEKKGEREREREKGKRKGKNKCLKN